MKVTIKSLIMNDRYDGHKVNARFVKEYIAGCEPYIVPGVTAWNNVQVDDSVPGAITVWADLECERRVSAGDFVGQPVTLDWVAKYIRGAGVYWLAPETLKATAVVAS